MVTDEIESLMSRLIFAATGPLAGWIADSHSPSTAFAACGTLFLGSGLTSLFFLRRHGAL